MERQLWTIDSVPLMMQLTLTNGQVKFMCLPNFYSFRQLIQDVRETDGQASKSQIRSSFMVCGEQLLAAELKQINMLLTVYSFFSIIYLKEVIILCKRPGLPFHPTSMAVAERRPTSVFCHTEFNLSETQTGTIMVFSLSEGNFCEMQVFVTMPVRSWECCVL